MKVLALLKAPDVPVRTNHLNVFPDSAVTLPGRPIVVPDAGCKPTLTVGPAYRIGRLGKNIERQFAWRYIDAMGLAAILIYPDINFTAFDGVVTTGEWFDPDPAADVIISLPCDPDFAVTLKPAMIDIEGIIEQLTRHTTIKTGDVIVPCMAGEMIILSDRISVNYNGQECLSKRLIY